MGQKVNPVGMRVGINKNWNSRWFASNKDYSNFLIEDNKIRKFIEKNLDKQAFLSHIEIERKKTNKGYVVTVQIFVARPGVVIGQDGVNINNLKKSLEKLINNTNLKVDVVEVKQPSVSGRLAGADIARSEGYKDGTMAINTLRSDIDYACSEAMTTYGKLGVKVWICRGEVEENRPSNDKKGE